MTSGSVYLLRIPARREKHCDPCNAQLSTAIPAMHSSALRSLQCTAQHCDPCNAQLRWLTFTLALILCSSHSHSHSRSCSCSYLHFHFRSHCRFLCTPLRIVTQELAQYRLRKPADLSTELPVRNAVARGSCNSPACTLSQAHATYTHIDA